MTSIKQRKGYENPKDLDSLIHESEESLLDEQQQDEIIDTFKTSHEINSQRMRQMVLYLYGLAAILFLVFLVFGIINSNLHLSTLFPGMSETYYKSASIQSLMALCASAYSNHQTYIAKQPIFKSRYTFIALAACGLSIFATIVLVLSNGFNSWGYFTWCLPLAMCLADLYHIHTILNFHKDIDSLNQLKYRCKGA